VRRDPARTRAIIDPERFITPPGFWEPNRAVLTPLGRRFLRSLRGKLIALRSVICEGHTANLSVPTSRFAVALSLDRARVMCNLLRRLGARAPVRLVFKGGTEPIATNSTEAGRRQNRRVEVVLRH
jgi:outer membrane protein OmpA-like peptidoglycan-associated protein